MLMAQLLRGSDDVEPRAGGEVARFPAPGLGEPAGGLVAVGRPRDRERGAIGQEAAEGDPPGAAELDQRQLRHVAVGRGALDDERRAGAVEDDRWRGIPGLDERLEASLDVAGPRAGPVVGILLDERP